MKNIYRLYITGICFLITNLMYAQAGLKIWDKRFGGTSDDYMQSMIATADGGFLLGGTSFSAANGDKSQLSQGNNDYWIVKIDGSGNKVWDKRFGGTSGEYMQSMIATADGGYLLGGHSSSEANGDKSQPLQGVWDYWVVKIDGSGNKVWDKCFGGTSDDYMQSMIATADGGYLLGGYSSSGANGDKSQSSQGGWDYWVVKMDGSGNKVWDKRFGGTDLDVLRSMMATADGGYLLGGYSSSVANGDKSQASQGSNDYWVVKIDGSGIKVWDKRFGGTSDDATQIMKATADGGYLLGGYSFSGANGDKSQPSQGSYDYWVVKIDGSGNKVWDKRYGGTDSDAMWSMIATADGGYLLGGNSFSGANGDKSQPSQGGEDYWVVKIDGSGNKVWDKRYGGTGSDVIWSMLAIADGGYVLGGNSSSEANGDKSQSSQGGYDYWVVKISGECSLTAGITPSTTQNTCAGSTLAFSGSSTGGTSPAYAWSSSPAGFSSTQQNPSFTTPNVTQSTNYVLTLTVTDAGCTATATTTVTVSPTPTVNTVSNQTVTAGGTTSAINFSGAVSNTTYSWTNSNPSIGLAASGTGDIAAFTAVNTGATAQVANISVTPITYGYAYVANSNSNTVSLINTTTNTVVKTIPVGTRPVGVSTSPDGSRVYVSNVGADNSVSVINTASNTVIATISVGSGPFAICTGPDGSRVYVANRAANTVSVINTVTNAVISTVSVGTAVEGMTISTDGTRLYLANTGGNTVTVFNTATNTVVTNITVGSGPQGMAVSPDGSKLYVTNYNNVSNSISVINTATNAVINTISVGTNPYGVCVSPDGSRVYVSNAGSNNVSVINTSTNAIVATIAVGSIPFGVSLSTGGGFLYVANYTSGTTSVINTSTNTVSATITVGTNPISLGNFTTGFNCTGTPKSFSITVNPSGPANITQMEYFIDADPGYGSGTAVSFTAGSSVTTNFPVNLSTTNDGFHFLNLRAKDVNNIWGVVGIRPFYKETIPNNTLTNLNQIEYFIDNDPGYGLGTAINFPPSSNESLVFTVLLQNNLADGFHFLNVRGKDINNKWSIIGVRPFYKETLATASLPNITAMEYFLDADPGYGSATAVSFTAGTNPSQNFTIPLPGTVADGFHYLSVRAKDANNKWSVVAVRPFYKETLPAGGLPNITAMEYFIDTDPGYGSGTAVSFTAGTNPTQGFTIGLGSLSNGTHTLFIRAKDVNNKWSVVGVKTFAVSNQFVIAGSGTTASWCQSTPFSITYTAAGTYNAGNVFTAQLSDASGNFNSPTVLGTTTGTVSGTITATIPLSVPVGNNYQLRIVSSNPSVADTPSIPFAVIANCPSPCPASLVLQSPPATAPAEGIDYNTLPAVVRQAAAANGSIVATNKVTGTANITYEAKNVTLNAGFKAEAGTVFIAQVGGCN